MLYILFHIVYINAERYTSNTNITSFKKDILRILYLLVSSFLNLISNGISQLSNGSTSRMFHRCTSWVQIKCRKADLLSAEFETWSCGLCGYRKKELILTQPSTLQITIDMPPAWSNILLSSPVLLRLEHLAVETPNVVDFFFSSVLCY